MNKIFKYSLLKFRPSSVLDEQVNIGILFIFSEDNRVFFRFPNSLNRLKALFPDIDLKDTQLYLSAIQDKALQLSHKNVTAEANSENFIAKSFFLADANSFFFSDFKAGTYETEGIEMKQARPIRNASPRPPRGPYACSSVLCKRLSVSNEKACCALTCGEF